MASNRIAASRTAGGRIRTLILALLVGAGLGAPGVQAAMSAGCQVPDKYLQFSSILDRTGGLIHRRRPVRVFALGPSFVPPRSAGGSLEQVLERRMPGVDFNVSEEQSPGLAEDDFDLLREAVSRLSPDLVIWQVGLPDAVASSDVQDFEEVLDQASAWVEAQGLDLVLVDPPFVPQVAHERRYSPYVGEIGEMSATDRVPVFRRYASMQYWNLEQAKRRGSPTESGGPPCVPEMLAEAISRAAR